MQTAPLDQESLRTVLEGAGLRCTAQRLAVYDHLSRAHHPTAEDVYEAVRSALPRISLATVYKALEALVATGVATKVSGGAGEPSARYDARPDPHYHFRCLRTGAVHDLPTRFDAGLIDRLDPRLADYLSRQGFKVTGYRLELLGYQDGAPALEGTGSASSTPGLPPREREGAGGDEGGGGIPAAGTAERTPPRIPHPGSGS
jgi:Fe2+ or Zn2+ uptake regulation protein